MLAWKGEDKKNSALLIEGARRIVKTTIVKEFGEKEYNNYLYIDFTYASDEVKEMFKRINPNSEAAMNQFFSDLMLYFGKQLEKGDLIIFDEVQFSPKQDKRLKLWWRTAVMTILKPAL